MIDPVHRDELVVVARAIDNGEGARECQLQPDQPRQHQSHQSDADIAVIEYWMAMTFASWQKTYFADPALRTW